MREKEDGQKIGEREEKETKQKLPFSTLFSSSFGRSNEQAGRGRDLLATRFVFVGIAIARSLLIPSSPPPLPLVFISLAPLLSSSSHGLGDSATPWK